MSTAGGLMDLIPIVGSTVPGTVSRLITVIAVLIGGALLGIVGALMAIPVAAAIKLMVEEIGHPRLDVS